MSALSSFIHYVSGIVVFGQVKTSGWVGFFLIAFLPFIGVRLLDWQPQFILASYVLDRMVYLIWFFWVETYMTVRSQQFEAKGFLRALFAMGVSLYMLLQLLGLVGLFSQELFAKESLHELGIIVLAITLWYGYLALSSLRTMAPEEWTPRLFKECVGWVLLTGFTLMVSLVIGVAWTAVLKNSEWGHFFGTGFGVVTFLFVVVRLATDLWFFRRAKRAAFAVP